MNTTSNPTSAGLFALKMGVLFSAISIALTTIFFAAGLIHSGRDPASFIPLLVNAILASVMIKNYRDKQAGGAMSFGSCFGLSFIGFLISGVIGTPFQYLFMNIWHPGLLQKQFDATRAQYLAQGMTDEQIDTAMKWMTTSMTNPAIFIIFGLAGFAFVGAIISLIVAAICKKDRNAFAGS